MVLKIKAIDPTFAGTKSTGVIKGQNTTVPAYQQKPLKNQEPKSISSETDQSWPSGNQAANHFSDFVVGTITLWSVLFRCGGRSWKESSSWFLVNLDSLEFRAKTECQTNRHIWLRFLAPQISFGGKYWTWSFHVVPILTIPDLQNHDKYLQTKPFGGGQLLAPLRLKNKLFFGTPGLLTLKRVIFTGHHWTILEMALPTPATTKLFPLKHLGYTKNCEPKSDSIWWYLVGVCQPKPCCFLEAPKFTP